MRRDYGKYLLAIVAAVLAAGITYITTDDGDGHKTRTVRLGPTPAQVTKAVQKAPPAGELQSTPAEVRALRDTTPEGVSQEALEKGDEAQEQIVENRDVPPAAKPIPQGGAQGYSCRRSYASRGYGGYRSHFSMFDIHYTVSAGRGWDVLYNMKRYLESVGLSATFIVDLDGRCLQTVPLNRNPYTQGRFNVYGVSVEIIATGKEPRSVWLAAPLIKDGILASLVRDTLRSHNLPVRFVDPVGCTPQAGYTDHLHLECGNDHVDVGQQFPWDVFNRQAQAKPKPVCRRACQLRAKHKRTHARFRKNKCGPRKHGYCDTLRSRNKAVHKAAKKERVKL